MFDIPQILHLKGECKERILLKYPDLKPIISDKITDDVTIVVDARIKKSYVETGVSENFDMKGVIHVNEISFEYILAHLRGMIANIKNGTSLRDAITQFNTKISKSEGEDACHSQANI